MITSNVRLAADFSHRSIHFSIITYYDDPPYIIALLLLSTCFPQNEGMDKVTHGLFLQINNCTKYSVLSQAGSFKTFLKNQGGNLGGLYGKQIEAIGGLAKYNDAIKTDLELAKTIGDAVVPIVTAGLAFIPVVGPLISGIFGSLWTAFSPLMESGSQNQDPIQVLQIQMEDYINKSITASEGRLNTNLKAKFREVIAKSIYAKNIRDRYDDHL